jgi:hypothetical protein
MLNWRSPAKPLATFSHNLSPDKALTSGHFALGLELHGVSPYIQEGLDNWSVLPLILGVSE